MEDADNIAVERPPSKPTEVSYCGTCFVARLIENNGNVRFLVERAAPNGCVMHPAAVRKFARALLEMVGDK